MARMVYKSFLMVLMGGAMVLHAAPNHQIEKVGLSAAKGKCTAWWQFSKANSLPSYFSRIVQNGAGIEVGFVSTDWKEETQTVSGQGVQSIRSLRAEKAKKPVLLFQLKLLGPGAKNLKRDLDGQRFEIEWNCSEKTASQWEWKPLSTASASGVIKEKETLRNSSKADAAPVPPQQPSSPPEQKNKAKKEESAEKAVTDDKTSSLDLFYKEQVEKLSLGREKKKGFVVQGARKVVVSNEKVLLYVEPDPKSMVVRTLNPGDTLFSAYKQGEWYVVDNLGREAYVSAADVRRLEEITAQEEELLRRLVQRQMTNLATSTDKVPLREVEVGASSSDTTAEADTLHTPSRAGKQYYRYSSFGRRDPFVPFEEPEIEGISIDEVQLVGIIWDAETPLAILEDVRVKGVSYTLREGDEVLNGHVYKISRDEVVFLLTEFGVSRKYSMPLPKIIE